MALYEMHYAAFLPNLQKWCATSRFRGGFTNSGLVDSYHSRQFPLFGAKKRRTFALFTTGEG
jgi:hypothetical protein